jgi:hypothetical protein
MKGSFASTVLILFLAMGVAFGGRAKCAENQSVDLSKLKRFALWGPIATQNGGADRWNEAEQHLRAGVASELDARGFQNVPDENAEFVVSCYVAEFDGSVPASDYDRNPRTGFFDHTLKLITGGQPRQGWVVVELLLPGDPHVIWRGQVKGVVGIDNSGREVDSGRELVNRLLKDMGQKLSY